MTIGIGVLCSTRPRPYVIRPDALVMISDTMGSTETDSTDALHKMYFVPEEKLYAVCTDRLEMGAELFPLIREELRTLKSRTHGSIWRALNAAVHKHRSDHFQCDVIMTKYAIGGQILSDQQEAMVREWAEFDAGVQMLLGAFDEEGFARLYCIARFDGSSALVHPIAFPGFCCIGTGSYNANVWLNYRHQHLGLNIKQSALHVYESSLMASSAPTVNDDVEMLIATKEHSYYCARQVSTPDCELSLKELARIAKKYGPKSTDDLGFPSIQQGAPTNPESTTRAPQDPPASQE